MRSLCGLVLLAVAVAAAPGTRQTADDPNDHAYNYTFPDGFFFSSATASYQIEGGWNASGEHHAV